MKNLLSIILLLFGFTAFGQKGTGGFTNEIKIGAKLSVDTNQAGMIQFTSGDFQGYDGSAWKSFVDLGVNYANVVTVAQSGGDFTTIQSGISGCTTTSPSNPCLVRVMPGSYLEPVITVPNNVHLVGSGRYTTFVIGQILPADSCLIEGFFISDGIVCMGTSPKITSNHIQNMSGAGIVVNGVTQSSRPWIENNRINNCVDYGIRCSGGNNVSSAANPWIIQNRIDSNLTGGIICTENAWPTISNNEITHNFLSGIVLMGSTFPSEPTITDNVIAHTIDVGGTPGVGIRLSNLAEPRIMLNDIYGNKIGISVLSVSQPSILSNNINYNDSIGIYCTSPGAGVKKVVIQSNHIHSNGVFGIEVKNPGDPVVSHNQISYHQIGVNVGQTTPFIYQNSIVNNFILDIQYTVIGPFPIISTNIYDNIAPGGLAGGIYNSTSAGGAIGP